MGLYHSPSLSSSSAGAEDGSKSEKKIFKNKSGRHQTTCKPSHNWHPCFLACGFPCSMQMLPVLDAAGGCWAEQSAGGVIWIWAATQGKAATTLCATSHSVCVCSHGNGTLIWGGRSKKKRFWVNNESPGKPKGTWVHCLKGAGRYCKSEEIRLTESLLV